MKKLFRRGLHWGKRWLRRILHRPAVFTPGYTLEDNTQVVVYADEQDCFPDYQPRVDTCVAPRLARVRVSLIATARNEATSAHTWFEAIWQQTRLPDEIVVVDTGSTDGTVDLLNQLAARSPIPTRVICAASGNIASGRNLAVAAAKHEVIAVTDFGTTAHLDWLERLVAPFEIDPRTQVSGGWYRAVDGKGLPRHRRFWLDLRGRNPQDILSPSATIAFTRQAWELAHGYPEWLTLTGEDTYFDLELRRCCTFWAFVPQALVDWQSPVALSAHWKRLFRWSTGDGESGFNADFYWRAACSSLVYISGGISFLIALLLALLSGEIAWIVLALLLGVGYSVILLRRAWRLRYYPLDLLWLVGAEAAQTLGFLRGASCRELVTRRRLAEVRGFFFILAGVPLDDTGGGSRFAQIALELVRQGFAVVYVYKFPSDESADLNLSIRHPNLFQFQSRSWDLQRFMTSYGLRTPLRQAAAMVEVPLADWLPLLDDLRRAGAQIIYDLVDDWQGFLGADWYSETIEKQIAASADHLTATLPVLQERLRQSSARTVTLLPNAVNQRLFDPQRFYPRPKDLPLAEWVILYTGALYGPWFDWDLLVETARAYPQAALVVIGDYRGQCPVRVSNLHFLGLKRQTDLPAYLAHAQVMIIPWVVSPITLATSPLKLYEYLAMRKPVVSPDLPALRGLPFVYSSSSAREFIQNINLARETPVSGAALDAFLAENSWQARVGRLLGLLGLGG